MPATIVKTPFLGCFITCMLKRTIYIYGVIISDRAYELNAMHYYIYIKDISYIGGIFKIERIVIKYINIIGWYSIAVAAPA